VNGNGQVARAVTLVAAMARELRDGEVVATGVASPLAILAIELARRSHAPNLTWLACVGSISPRVETLRPCSEDLRYLEGRSGQVTIPDLFDHARRGRIDVMFFGAAEVDAYGATNLTAAGSLDRPKYKFPGVAGAATLRRWVHRPVLTVPQQSRRNLVPRVQIASTSDPCRPIRLLTNLGVFELGPEGATLLSRHAGADLASIHQQTGFEFTFLDPLPVTPEPDLESAHTIRSIDAERLCERIVA
jgi:glutaconate CoA-transferase subunit B